MTTLDNLLGFLGLVRASELEKLRLEHERLKTQQPIVSHKVSQLQRELSDVRARAREDIAQLQKRLESINHLAGGRSA
jgi:uncharacterized protein YlxW (UPF0749 family)